MIIDLINFIRSRLKTIILLDIDGTIAPLGIVNDGVIVSIDGWSRVSIPSDVVEWLQVIDNDFKIIWSSTWCANSLAVSQQLNLSISDYINYTGESNEFEWLKIRQMNNFIDKHYFRNIIIIDDELPSELTFREGVILIRPNDLTGISNVEMKSVLNYK